MFLSGREQLGLAVCSLYLGRPLYVYDLDGSNHEPDDKSLSYDLRAGITVLPFAP